MKKTKVVLAVIFVVCPTVGYCLVYPEVGQPILGISFFLVFVAVAAKAVGDIRKEESDARETV
jgi:hypothetical protein